MTEDFYTKLDYKKRKKIIDSAEPSEDLLAAKALFELRYKPNSKNGEIYDSFIRAALELKICAEQAGSFFMDRSNKKHARKALDDLCVGKEAEFGEEVLYREYCQLASLYISLCSKDKAYGSVALGIGRVSDERIAARIRRDLELISTFIPEYLDMKKELSILSKAFDDTKEALLNKSDDADED